MNGGNQLIKCFARIIICVRLSVGTHISQDPCCCDRYENQAIVLGGALDVKMPTGRKNSQIHIGIYPMRHILVVILIR